MFVKGHSLQKLKITLYTQPKKSPLSKGLFGDFVLGMGVEPTRPKTHAPQACTSTNSATRVIENIVFLRYANV